MQPLEDVRNDNSIPYIKKLRGIPNDATETVKEKAQDAYETIQAAAKFVKKLYFDLLNITFEVRNVQGSHLDIDDTRLIFWVE